MPATSQIPPVRPDDAVRASPSLHWSRTSGWKSVAETLAAEAPLAIEIAYERGGQEIRKVLAVTMRTPGGDEELALGFLFAEGLVASLADVAGASAELENSRGEKIPTQRVRLARPPREDLQRVSRGLVTSAACGLCGRPSLEGLPLPAVTRDPGAPALSCELIATLPEKLRREQRAFSATGGCHGAALCDSRGEALLVREDVGRHNAVDKLVGAALQRGLASAGKILVLSGRASFELAQKAAAAGIAVMVAVGAPSSAAVALAHAAGITLVGFTREGRFNVYAHADRLALAPIPAAAPAFK
ncbi:MAG TPA: formate dehydrogenase accessory sulfurtransferase FdhD [Opitutus sp.]|nr:formate dehydrogenase accessory sulfurtransferase FdhD [Opitutus sp.]